MIGRKAPHTEAPRIHKLPKRTGAVFRALWVALFLGGCATQGSITLRNQQSELQSSTRGAEKPKSVERGDDERREQSFESGLPNILAPLDHLAVSNFAFANDSAYAPVSEAHVAGAIEDAEGLTVCLLSGRLSIPDGSMIAHPAPFSLRTRVRCFREARVQIARIAQPSIGVIDTGVALSINVMTSEGLRKRVYPFAEQIAVKEEEASETKPRSRNERVGKPPPWIPSITQDLRASRMGYAGLSKIHLSHSTTVEAEELAVMPSWVAMLERNSELATNHLGNGDRAEIALTLSRGSLVDREPARQILAIREAGRWLCSDVLSEVIMDVADVPTFGPSAIFALTRTSLPSTGPKARFPYADEALVHVLLSDGGALRHGATLQVGEVGHARYLGKNRVWRVFYQVRAVGPGCLEVRRDHAITGLFDRRRGRLIAATRIRAGIAGLPDDVPRRYAKIEGQYTWNGEELVRGPCK